MSSEATHDIQTLLRERVVPSGGTRHGLAVGIETYRDPRLNLRCARADAQAVYDMMVEHTFFPSDGWHRWNYTSLQVLTADTETCPIICNKASKAMVGTISPVCGSVAGLPMPAELGQ